MRKHLSLVALVLAVFTVMGAGCSATTDGSTAVASGGTTAVSAAGTTPVPRSSGTATGSITVSAASSLSDAFKTIRDGFKATHPGVGDVWFNFDSSSAIVTQIQTGAPVDVAALADETTMKKLTGDGLVAGSPSIFARNRLAIVVKEGNPKGIRSLADLPRAGTISLCGEKVPCGAYADQILEAAKVTIPADSITRASNAKSAFSAVANGDADAGIVYVTDITGDKVEAVSIPDEHNVIAVYPVAGIASSRNSTAAEAFIDYVLSAAGQDELRAAGFLSPS